MDCLENALSNLGSACAIGRTGPFCDPHPISHAHTQVNLTASRRILCFQRRKFKKSEYIVHLFEFLR